ncbi:MAG: GAF domain-containing protein [Candidatus Hermodarchaeota archaeon]
MSPKLGIKIRDKIIETFTRFEDDRVYSKVLTIILSVIESDYGIFGYIKEDGDLVLPSFTKEVWERCEIPSKDIAFPRGDWANSNGLWARSIVQGKTFQSNQPLNPPEGHIPMNRAIAVPLLYQKRVIGMISVANKKSNYTKEDVKGLEKIAEYISPILYARLEGKKQLEELKKLKKKRDWEDKVIKLDNIDKHILLQLHLDGRESKPLMAKNLEMSHTGIQNRIKKLTESNTLKIQGNINFNSLGIRAAYVNIELKNYDYIEKFVSIFTKCPRVFLISRITGRFHLKFGIIGRNIDDLNSFINYCLLVDKNQINSTEIIFASDLSKPEFFPINLFDIDNRDTPCGRNCLRCEAYSNERCYGCNFF